MTDKILVMVTCRSQAEAKKIAQSIYRWNGKIETAREVLVLVKSTRRRFSALEREIRRLHSYDTPEIIALPIVQGSRAYLRWIGESVRPLGRGDSQK